MQSLLFLALVGDPGTHDLCQAVVVCDRKVELFLYLCPETLIPGLGTKKRLAQRELRWGYRLFVEYLEKHGGEGGRAA